jgi:hypothetical protein
MSRSRFGKLSLYIFAEVLGVFLYIHSIHMPFAYVLFESQEM